MPSFQSVSTFPADVVASAGAWSQHPVLSRLFWLRWAILGGELLVLAGAALWLEIALPLPELLALMAVQAAINVATAARMRLASPAAHGELFLQLLLDVVVLSALLYFSGGATNPFVSFFLPTLAAGAAALAWPWAGALTLCALGSYSALVYVYQPLHIHDHEQAMAYHLVGMWINFSISALLITWFVTRIAAAMRTRDTQLAQVREQQLRGQRIVALGTQAAGAAHALNTPLSTVAVIAGELRRDMAHNAALALYEEDLQVVEQQIAVCRQALDSMRLDVDAQGQTHQPVLLGPWLRELLDGWRLRHPAVVLVRDLALLEESTASTRFSAELEQILLTLLDNAAHAVSAMAPARPRGEVSVQVLPLAPSRGQPGLLLRVSDNGTAIAPELLARLGHGPVPSTTGGRGIGLMLAFAAAGHMGALLRLQSTPGQGTQAELRFSPEAP